MTEEEGICPFLFCNFGHLGIRLLVENQIVSCGNLRILPNLPVSFQLL